MINYEGFHVTIILEKKNFKARKFNPSIFVCFFILGSFYEQ